MHSGHPGFRGKMRKLAGSHGTGYNNRINSGKLREWEVVYGRINSDDAAIFSDKGAIQGHHTFFSIG